MDGFRLNLTHNHTHNRIESNNFANSRLCVCDVRMYGVAGVMMPQPAAYLIGVWPWLRLDRREKREEGERKRAGQREERGRKPT